mmetsp:Transcript_104121/g.212445  ORF Transcript_104121/g.212445 Transcript_104121/m.212445 type:complete len:105 (-) Transcript_104121:115-429(-)
MAEVVTTEVPVFEGVPGGVTYVTDPVPMPMPTMMYMQAPAPTRFNISPEKFAVLAAGGSLSQEEIADMLGEQAPVPLGTTAAVTTKGSKKKVKLSKKKKSRGCC